jgi:hypothetical protein
MIDEKRALQTLHLLLGCGAINCRRLVGTMLLKGDEEEMFYLKGETCLT